MPSTRRTPLRGARPANTRPGRRSRAGASAQSEATARPRFTNRAVVLVVVFAVLVISYGSSMKAYLQQRSQIAELRSQIADSKKGISAAQREKGRWQDPAYVQAQARARFGWVLPGETAYQVLDRNGDPLTSEDTLTDPSTVTQSQPDAWWVKVNGTLAAADHPPKVVKQTPATRIKPPKTSLTP